MTIKTFCAPFTEAVEEDRRDCHLRPDDIDKALEFFGPGLVKLYINPMYLSGKTKLDYTFPENIEVVGHAGVAGWELQGEVKETLVILGTNKEMPIPEQKIEGEIFMDEMHLIPFNNKDFQKAHDFVQKEFGQGKNKTVYITVNPDFQKDKKFHNRKTSSRKRNTGNRFRPPRQSFSGKWR